MIKRRPEFDPFRDKKVFRCKFCNFPITNPGLYPGKKIMINRYCPECHSNNTFALLNKQDQTFLRMGFFSNPLYPISPHHLKGVPLKFSLIVFPLSVFFNFVANIVYMPFGLIYNNIQIKKALKEFYASYKDQDTNLILIDMLEKKAGPKNQYASYKTGIAYLEGIHVPYDLEKAESYFKIAKEEHEGGLVKLAETLIRSENPNYDKAFTILNLVKDNPLASYYLAYLYFYGYGVTPSLRIATIYAGTAHTHNIKDYYDIYPKILQI
jgi:TPR repeat protein